MLLHNEEETEMEGEKKKKKQDWNIEYSQYRLMSREEGVK